MHLRKRGTSWRTDRICYHRYENYIDRRSGTSETYRGRRFPSGDLPCYSSGFDGSGIGIVRAILSISDRLPEQMIGRAMTDIEKMNGTFEITQAQGGLSVLTGRAPVSEMQDYPKEVAATRKASDVFSSHWMAMRHAIMRQKSLCVIGYDAEHDTANPSGSVFCAHGAGFTVPWNEVKEHMHVEGWQPETVKRKNFRNGQHEVSWMSGSVWMK